MSPKIADIVQDMMSSAFIRGMVVSTQRRYVYVGYITLRHPCLVDVAKELNQRFPCSLCLGMTALDDVVFTDCDEDSRFCSSLLVVRGSATKTLFPTPVPSIILFFSYSIGY